MFFRSVVTLTWGNGGIQEDPTFYGSVQDHLCAGSDTLHYSSLGNLVELLRFLSFETTAAGGRSCLH